MGGYASRLWTVGGIKSPGPATTRKLIRPKYCSNQAETEGSSAALPYR
jgi:hypothetical protein